MTIDLIKNARGRTNWLVFACASLVRLVGWIVNRTNNLFCFVIASGLHTFDSSRYSAIFFEFLVV